MEAGTPQTRQNVWRRRVRLSLFTMSVCGVVAACLAAEGDAGRASARQVMMGLPHTLGPSFWWLDYPARRDPVSSPTPAVMFKRVLAARELYGSQAFQIRDWELVLPFLRKHASALRRSDLDVRIILAVQDSICGTLRSELPVGSTQVHIAGDSSWVKMASAALPPQVTFMSGQREMVPYRGNSVVIDSRGCTIYFEKPTTKAHPAGTVVCCWSNLVRQLDAIKSGGFLDRVAALCAMEEPKTLRHADGSFVPMNLAPVQAELRRIAQRMGVSAPVIWGLPDPAALASFDYSQDYVLSCTDPVRAWGFQEEALRQRAKFLAAQGAKVIFGVQTGDLGSPKTYGACTAREIYEQLVIGASPVKQADANAFVPATVAWCMLEPLLEGPQDANSVSAAVQAMKGTWKTRSDPPVKRTNSPPVPIARLEGAS